MTGTPPLSAFVRNQIEQRERQWQTSFPAKVLAWDSANNTVQLEPQFIEAWRDGEERVTETIAAPEDAYIDNVPVLFQRSGPWRMTFPIVTGSFGLVTCTKFSLDVWRKQGNATDPGDLRRFTMSGATFEPSNLHPDASALSNVDGSYMILSQGGTVDFVALKTDVDDIKTFLDEIKADFNAHTHGGVLAGPAFTGNPTASTPPVTISSTYTVTASSKVKVE